MQRPAILLLWYAAQSGSATFSPWLGSLLTDAGWSASAVTALLVTVPLGRLLGGPMWSWFADRIDANRVLVLAAVASLVSGLLLGIANELGDLVPPLLVAFTIVAYGVSRSPMFAIVDASVVRWVGDGYGRIRAVGSISFLLLVFGGGLMRDTWAKGPLWLALGALVLATAFTLALPPMTQPTPRRPTWRDVVALTRHRPLVVLVVVSALHGFTMSSYDQLYTLHIDTLGLPAWVTGSSFALGVLAEVGVLFAGRALLGGFGRRGVLLIGVAAGIPRFLLTAVVTSPVALVAIQSLHGLHFGAFWIAATSAFAGEAPPELRNSTQALLPAAAYGAGPMVGMLVAWANLQLGGSLSVHYALVAGVSMVATALVWGQRLEGAELNEP